MQNRQLELNRARSLGDIISDTFAFQKPNWRTFAAVVGPAVLIGIIMQLVFFALAPETPADLNELSDDELTEYVQDTLIAAGVILLILPVTWVIYQLTTAGAVVVVRSIGEGQAVPAGDALDAAQDRVKDLLLTSLRMTVIVFLFAITIIGIPIAIHRLVAWCLAIQAIMVEGATHKEALGRSAALVRGSWWLTFGRLIVIALLTGMAGGVVSTAISAILPGVPGILLAGCVAFFTTPFAIIATTLIFYDQKQKHTNEAADGGTGHTQM